jgi:hypothetical protein
MLVYDVPLSLLVDEVSGMMADGEDQLILKNA